MINTKQRRMDNIAAKIKACRDCSGMNEPSITESAPGYGSVDSPVVLVGQSLCEKCMESGIPFTGGSGKLLDSTFEQADRAKGDLFTTNVVHCHPPGNRPSKRHEIDNCHHFLRDELAIVEPVMAIGLGKDAERALTSLYPDARTLPWPFDAPRPSGTARGPDLLFAKHPSWIKRQHDSGLEYDYIASLARAIRWAFDGR